MNILEQVEASIRTFRPRNQREVAVLQIARRFDDLPNLPRYLIAATRYSKADVLAAATVATNAHEPIQRASRFFDALAQAGKAGP